MIEWRGKTWRNLEEQVLYLTERLEDAIRSQLVLAQMGIKVVGNVPTAEDLPNPADYEGDYGDAYITEDDNHYYIFTRPFDGDEYPHWFDIGVFPAPGPEGPAGPQGEQGETGQRGSLWYTTGESYPAVPADGQAGDMILHTSGSGLGVVERLSKAGNALYWATQGSIRGPKGDKGDTGSTGPVGPAGPAGQQGPQGQPGQPFTILGELSSVDDLPLATEEYLDDAYVIPDANGAMHIWYIPAGVTPYAWTDMGAFTNYGTMVTEGGQFVATFDADTKITKPSATYCVIYLDGSGNVLAGGYSASAADANTFAKRTSSGALIGATANDNVDNTGNMLVNKTYAKSLVASFYDTRIDIKTEYDDHIYLDNVILTRNITNDADVTIFNTLFSRFGQIPICAPIDEENQGDIKIGYFQFTSSSTFIIKTPTMNSPKQCSVANAIVFGKNVSYFSPTLSHT